MQPLEDITVIDATQALAGPFVGQTLGDLGADVIKIERPDHGDLTRTYSPRYGEEFSAYFVSTNRNKRGVSLDLTTAEGQAILRDLVEEADVFVQNFSPGNEEAFDAEYGTLSAINDELVYCDISGYGQDSPYADRKSFDIILQGESGMMSVTGTEDQPARIGVSICDLAGAMTAIYSILTALYHRERTGEGEYIDVSLLDASFQFLGYHVANYFATGENPKRMGTRHPSLMPYQAFETADSHIVVGVVSEHIWPKFCRALDRGEWIDDERYATFSDRVENRDELDPVLDDVFAERTTDEWMTILQAENVPCTPVRDVETLVEDPHIETRGMIAEMEHPELGTFRSPANPVNFASLEIDAAGPPPRLGEHTDEVLAELGYDDAEREQLQANDVI